MSQYCQQSQQYKAWVSRYSPAKALSNSLHCQNCQNSCRSYYVSPLPPYHLCWIRDVLTTKASLLFGFIISKETYIYCLIISFRYLRYLHLNAINDFYNITGIFVINRQPSKQSFPLHWLLFQSWVFFSSNKPLP